LLARHRELAPLIDQLDFALRAVDLAPRHASSHALVGDAERALHHTDRALQAYQLAARLATPDELAPIVLRLARLLEDDLQQVDEALAVLDGAAADPGGLAPDARLVVRAGDLLVRAGRWTEAVSRYERAQALRPRDGAIQQRLESARAGLEASRAGAEENDR
jgi:tetratricopeptide (TPR) repeat protein